MPSAEWIAAQYTQFVHDRGQALNAMREATEMYEGTIAIPLPGLDKTERLAIANVAQNAIDQHSMRIASVMPGIDVPPTREGSDRSDKRARKQRDIHYGWWFKNNYKLRRRQQARWLTAYGSGPVMVRPPRRQEIERMGGFCPVFEERNPLSTFYPLSASQSDVTPEFGITAVRRSWSWLTTRFPDKVLPLNVRQPRPSDQFDVLEYVDADELHLVVLGQRDPYQAWPPMPHRVAITLDQTTNWAGVCTLVVPGRINLDRPMGMIDSLYGMMLKAGKLDAIEYFALLSQAIPEEWEEGYPQGGTPRVTREANPLQGIRGAIHGGRIDRKSVDPSILVMNNPIDRLERNMKFNAGTPSQWSGEFPTNVRSNAQSAGIVGETVNFSTQEHHEILAHADEEVLRRGIRVAKGWHGSQPVSIYVGFPGVKDKITYRADTDLYTEDVHVSYALPGVDADNASVVIGNTMALGLLSRKTGRRLHPQIEDPDYEESQVQWEELEMGLKAEMAQPGAMPVHLRARIMQLVRENGLSLVDAVLKVQKEAQEEQAQQVSAPPGSPESQPGLAPEPELVAPEVQGPLDQLGQLFFAQRSAGRGVPV
jgi:hypothetical protein